MQKMCWTNSRAQKGGKRMAEWISVKDEPPKQTFLLVWCDVAKCVEIAKYNGCFWITQEKRHALNADWITHWMPLPKPPKEA